MWLRIKQLLNQILFRRIKIVLILLLPIVICMLLVAPGVSLKSLIYYSHHVRLVSFLIIVLTGENIVFVLWLTLLGSIVSEGFEGFLTMYPELCFQSPMVPASHPTFGDSEKAFSGRRTPLYDQVKLQLISFVPMKI